MDLEKKKKKKKDGGGIDALDQFLKSHTFPRYAFTQTATNYNHKLQSNWSLRIARVKSSVEGYNIQDSQLYLYKIEETKTEVWRKLA